MQGSRGGVEGVLGEAAPCPLPERKLKQVPASHPNPHPRQPACITLPPKTHAHPRGEVSTKSLFPSSTTK